MTSLAAALFLARFIAASNPNPHHNPRYNKIGPRGSAHLATQLHRVPLLTYLDVGYNGLGAAGAAHLASALPHVPRLATLLLWGNRLRPDGCTHVAGALRHVPRLTCLKLQ